MNILYGKLNIGEFSGVKIINELKEKVKNEKLVLIDCPPGTSCSTVAAVEESDFSIVVAEPTPFGVSDLKMVVEMLKKMNKKFGVVINKAGLGNGEIYNYLKNNNIRLLEEIPFNEEIAKLYSNGQLFFGKCGIYSQKFQNIIMKIKNQGKWDVDEAE
ncbi:MAG: P-loop NTPase [Cetobacterium sp.]|uniref:P-loop NTPase n=1 Tax=Cetobacterium sp. TaxID=2071632 RepID=UPI003F2C1544